MGWFASDASVIKAKKKRMKAGEKSLEDAAGLAALVAMPVIVPIAIGTKILGGKKKKKR